MTTEDRWQAVARQITVETNPEKLMALVAELTRLLEERQNQVKWQPDQSSEEEIPPPPDGALR
jgi:hypothetical protein